jgi:hypothetical protein
VNDHNLYIEPPKVTKVIYLIGLIFYQIGDMEEAEKFLNQVRMELFSSLKDVREYINSKDLSANEHGYNKGGSDHSTVAIMAKCEEILAEIHKLKMPKLDLKYFSEDMF